jgi:hypothetical protein
MKHLCECGCGQEVTKSGNRFIFNHHQKKPDPKLCACGCGEYAKPGRKYIHNHHIKGKPFTEEHKEKIRSAQIGRKCTPEHIEKNRKAQLGKKHSKETKQKISIGNLGKIVTAQTREKLSSVISSEEVQIKIALTKAYNETMNGNISTKEYCDVWYDNEYKNDLLKPNCQGCGITKMMSIHLFGFCLSRHHKDENKHNCHPDNIATLCSRCHTMEHHGVKTLCE